jgi:glycosyltransferase involved in cell wall biosynthesis
VRELARKAPSFPLPERFLLHVGKLEENKGVRSLVPALARARTGLPLVILGEGSLTHAVKLEAAAAGIDVVHRGWAEREDVLRALQRTAALVFPSLWPEPLSRVLLEALALGTPMAAMDTGGTSEVLSGGECGLLVPGVEDLAEAVRRLVEDEPLRARLRDAALRRAAAFSPEVLVPRYEAVYRRLQ